MTMPASTWPLPSEARLPITRTFVLVSRQLKAIVGLVPGVAFAVGAKICVSPSAAAATSATAFFKFCQVVHNLGEFEDGHGERGIGRGEHCIGFDELGQGGAFRRDHSSQAVEATLDVFQGCRGGAAGGRFTSAVGGERQSLGGGANLPTAAPPLQPWKTSKVASIAWLEWSRRKAPPWLSSSKPMQRSPRPMPRSSQPS